MPGAARVGGLAVDRDLTILTGRADDTTEWLIGRLKCATCGVSLERKTCLCSIEGAGWRETNALVGVKATVVARTPAGPNSACPPLARAYDGPRRKMATSDAVPRW